LKTKVASAGNSGSRSENQNDTIYKSSNIMTLVQPSALELLSALADGELVDDGRLGGEADFQSNALHGDWDSYQVIGHALRRSTEAAALTGADPDFLQRLNLRLANEMISLPVVPVSREVRMALPVQAAANQAVLRWKMLASFASISAALVLGWSFFGIPDASTSLQLSQGPAPEQVLVLSPQGPIVRDARLEELLAAHQQFGGSSLRAPSGFLRNAGFEDSQSGRR
jgi:sigma-E factor negative regulatory protein RseA